MNDAKRLAKDLGGVAACAVDMSQVEKFLDRRHVCKCAKSLNRKQVAKIPNCHIPRGLPIPKRLYAKLRPVRTVSLRKIARFCRRRKKSLFEFNGGVFWNISKTLTNQNQSCFILPKLKYFGLVEKR